MNELYTNSSEEEKSPSSNQTNTVGTTSENLDQEMTSTYTQSPTQLTENNQINTPPINTPALITIQESEDSKSRQSSNSQNTPIRSTTTSTNHNTSHVTLRTVLNSTALDNNEEDDINTQQSEETLTGDRVQTQTVLPSWIRFRTIINVKKPPLDVIAKK